MYFSLLRSDAMQINIVRHNSMQLCNDRGDGQHALRWIAMCMNDFCIRENFSYIIHHGKVIRSLYHPPPWSIGIILLQVLQNTAIPLERFDVRFESE